MSRVSACDHVDLYIVSQSNGHEVGISVARQGFVDCSEGGSGHARMIQLGLGTTV